MQMDVVVDEVRAEEAEEFAGAVVAAVGGAVEFELALAGEALAVGAGGDEDGEGERMADAPEGEGAAQEVVRRAFGADVDFLRGAGGELGGGVVLDVEEIGGAQVREEQRFLGRVGEVFIGDAGHVDGEPGGEELALAQDDFAGGELHGAAVVVEEVAPGPADDALGGVDAEGAIGDGWLGQAAGALQRQAGGAPGGEPALEGLHVGEELGGAKLGHGGGGIERALARAVDDDGGGRVGHGRAGLVEKGHLVDAGVVRPGDAGGGEDLRRQDVEELRGLGGGEEGLEVGGGHGGRMNYEG